MKRILAMVLASVIVVSSPAAIAYAEDGSKSVTAKDIEALQKEIAALNDTNKELNQKIEMLTEAVKAKDTNITINNNPTITNSPTNTNSPSNTNSFSPTNTNTNTNKNDQKISGSGGNNGGGSGKGSGSSSTSHSSTSATGDTNANYVDYNGCRCYPVKKIELNGAKSNATFLVSAPDGGTVTNAKGLAKDLGGELVNTVSTSAPGVSFATAKVNFFVEGVTDSDTIAVYQLQNGKWVQLTVYEVRKDHVVINMTKHGVLAFIRVPAVATTG